MSTPFLPVVTGASPANGSPAPSPTDPTRDDLRSFSNRPASAGPSAPRITADGGDPPPQDPPPDPNKEKPMRGTVLCTTDAPSRTHGHSLGVPVPPVEGSARARRAALHGGIVARPEEAARALRAVGHRVAATFMVLAALVMLFPPAASEPGDHGAIHHEHDAPPLQPHQAGLATGLLALWSHAQALAHDAWSALRAPERCSDCNLIVGTGCRCDCYSGGYDPRDPACQE
jgi:hypothetical protein